MLTDYSEKILNDFLRYYGKKGSKTVFENAIKHLFDVIEKNDVRLLTYSDYLSIEGTSSQDKYRTSFFKYIYAFSIVENEDGFENFGTKNNVKKHFEGLLSRQKNKVSKKEYKPYIVMEDIDKIENFLNFDDADNNDVLLLGLCWYFLFYTDCDVNELRKNIDCKNYNTGQIKSKYGNDYEIPEKYQLFIEKIKNRNKNTGFSELDKYIMKLGNYVGIQKLTPIMIKMAKAQNMLICSECGESYSNKIENWEGINNKIICLNCANNVKKNSQNNIKVTIINNIKISENRNEELSSMVYSFETLKNKLLNEKDYINEHKFNIYLGKAGEAFAYEYEKKLLIGTKYFNMIDNTKALNPENGYDILSYDKNGNEKYIEVKTTINKNNDFYISEYELNILKQMKEEGKKYLIYRVSNIFSENNESTEIEEITNILEDNRFVIQACNWRVARI